MKFKKNKNKIKLPTEMVWNTVLFLIRKGISYLKTYLRDDFEPRFYFLIDVESRCLVDA